MSKDDVAESIQLLGDRLVEINSTMFNLTGIPDHEFRPLYGDAEDDGSATESMGSPLIDFDCKAINLTGIPDEMFVPLDDLWEGDPDLPQNANGTAIPSALPKTPVAPESV